MPNGAVSVDDQMEFSDADFRIVAKADQSKKLAWDVSAIPTGTTVTTGYREVLRAARTYFVRTDGSDSNTGLANTSGGAFLTIAKALTAAAGLDCSTFNVTVQVGAGTWTVSVSLPFMLGSGTFTLLGDASTPANVIISTTSAHAIALNGRGNWTVNGFTVQTASSGYGLFNNGQGIISFLNLVLGACATSHFGVIGNLAQIIRLGNYSLSGNAPFHWVTQAGAYLFMGGGTVTVLASVTFTAWAFESQSGLINAANMTFTLGAFTVTGSRYNISGTSVLDTNGGGASYLPGSTAGSSATGAQYI